MSLPVGSIVPFAADNVAQLSSLGWVLCDGAQQSKSANPELWQSIGYANGGQNDTFFLPDLRGLFIRGNFPSGPLRSSPGTKSVFSTFNPGFQVRVNHVPGDFHYVDHGSLTGAHMVKWQDGSTTFNVIGGDNETRPTNVYMQYIIKVANKTILPIGTIVPYAGTDNAVPKDSTFIPCTGAVVSQVDYNDLYKVIGNRFTVPRDDDKFQVPDLAGLFVRGVNAKTGHDPDVTTRLPAADGTTGDAVGTFQRYATNSTGPNPMKVTISHFPNYNSTFLVVKGTPKVDNENLAANGGFENTQTWSIAKNNRGPESETRPSNVYIQNYINASNSIQLEKFPLGGIAAIPGSGAPDSNYWLPALGQSLAITDYPKLFNILGTAWGGDATHTHFNLPQLSGQFLRGVDYLGPPANPYGDPDHASRSISDPYSKTVGVGSRQSFATAMPRNTLNLQNFSVSTAQYYNPKGAVGQVKISQWDSGSSVESVNGGDPETAPRNVAVAFYIKVNDF
ncbi:MAG: hypothetical protein Q9167_004783 [Letrouitia subvulpina]